VRLLLLSAMVVGALGSITVGGTWALYGSEAVNRGISAASGTLIMTNTVNSGAVCYSYGAGEETPNTNTCDALVDTGTLNYPGTPVTTTVAVTNDGTVDASRLAIYMPGCTDVVTSAPAGAPAAGGGDLCSNAAFDLQETDADGNDLFCWYPEYGNTDCGLDGVLGDIWNYAPDSSTEYPLTDAGSGLVGLAVGQTRYFKVSMEVPDDNAYQREGAEFSLVWHLTS
jgi:hypothetical protein